MFQIAVNFGRWRNLEAHELTYATLHRFKHRQIIMMNKKRSVQLGTNPFNAEHVIEVCVSYDDVTRVDLDVTYKADDSLRLIARVDDYRGSIGLQNVAVGPQLTNNDSVYLRQCEM